MKEGWEMKKLADIANIFAGGDAPKGNLSKVKTDEFRVPIIANAIKNNGIYGYTNKAKVTKPSITVAARGSGTGHTEYRNYPFVPIVRLIVLTPDTEIINVEFLLHAIKNLTITKSGSAIPQLTVPMIKEYTIPIPSLTEQKQIVALLDQAFAAIDQAQANIEKNIQNAKELFESKLNEIFSQKGDGWEEKSLGEVTTKIGSGSTPRGGQASYKESGISLIRSMNVHDEGFRDKKLAFIDEEQAGKLNNVIIYENDVLLNITGASVARCCVVDKNYLPARVNQHVSIIRLKDEIMNHQFLHYALTSKLNKKLLLGIGEQGATRQAITKAQIEKFVIKYPSDINLQKKLVDSLDVVKKETLTLEETYRNKFNSLRDLKKSLLQKAFSGELVV